MGTALADVGLQVLNCFNIYLAKGLISTRELISSIKIGFLLFLVVFCDNE